MQLPYRLWMSRRGVRPREHTNAAEGCFVNLRSVAFDFPFLRGPFLPFFDGGAQEVVLGWSRDPSTTAKEVAANATAMALLCGECGERGLNIIVDDAVCRREKGRRERRSWIRTTSLMQDIAQPPQKSSAEGGRWGVHFRQVE